VSQASPSQERETKGIGCGVVEWKEGGIAMTDMGNLMMKGYLSGENGTVDDISAIRKKHEARKAYLPLECLNVDADKVRRRKSNLTISDVDALLAALDARNDLLTLCEKQRDKTVEKNDELKAALDEAPGQHHHRRGHE